MYVPCITPDFNTVNYVRKYESMVHSKKCSTIEKFMCSKNYAKSFSDFVLYISNMISPFKTINDNDTQNFV